MEQLDSLLSLIAVANPTDLEDRLELSFNLKDLRSITCDLSEWLDSEVLSLTIDDDLSTSWVEINGAHESAKCVINLLKKEFIEKVLKCDLSVSNFVFFSTKSFLEWVNRLKSPFDATHPFYKNQKNLIWVHSLEQPYIGSNLSIIPLNFSKDRFFSSYSDDLPCDQEIRSQVHFVSKDSVMVEPVRFKLPNEALQVDTLKPFFRFYEMLLGACLVKEYYSLDRVVVSGIKRLTLSLSPDLERNLSIENIGKLEEAVRWVYGERTETRLLLLMDRVSLDLPESGSLIPGIYSHLTQALEQAQNRYEFVIKDRKEAHAKELAELQKDVKSATNSFSSATNDLVSGLLKDALSSIFILTIMLFSRLIGKDDIFEQNQVSWLFYGLAAYLMISVITRIFVSKKGLKLSLEDLNYWQDTTRNHMSENEFKSHVDSRTKPYQSHYCQSALGIFSIYVVLALFVCWLPSLISKQKAVESTTSVEAMQSEQVNQRDTNLIEHQVIEKKITSSEPIPNSKPKLQLPSNSESRALNRNKGDVTIFPSTDSIK
jgi:uncharacterized protein YjgD (DUF1641 family)